MGLVDEFYRDFSAPEYALARRLAAEGAIVQSLPTGGRAGRFADALVNGVPTEFKTPSDRNTESATIRNEVQRSLRRGGQARRIVIDARGTGLTRQEALRAMRRIGGVNHGRLDQLRIIGRDFDLSYRY